MWMTHAQVMLSRGGAEANGEDDPDYNAEHSPRPVKRRNTKGANAAAAAAAAAADEDMVSHTDIPGRKRDVVNIC